jgi:radical SAM protein with 4Fe4S-binding SPASM domain
MTRFATRPLNFIQSACSFIASSLSGRQKIKGMPVSVSFELTNNCNLNCPECASGSDLLKRPRGFMDPELYKKVADELRPYLYYVNFYFQGEPLLHPQFYQFPGIVKDAFSVISTNGHFLSPENAEMIIVSGLRKLIVSLDGMDQETYSSYRINGDFARVAAGIKNVALARDMHRSPLKLEIQFLVNRKNEHQIREVRRFAKEVKAGLRLKSMQIINTRNMENWLPSAEKFRRYEKRDGVFNLKSSYPNRCMRLWFNPVVTWDGKVLPCCFDKDGEYVMGDLKTGTFRSIWNGQRYSDFREHILTGRDRINMCRNCTSGLRGVYC